MSGDVEFADGARNNPFPRHWGNPRGAPGSQERSIWVLSRVRKHVVDRKLTTDPGLREAYLARKRVGP